MDPNTPGGSSDFQQKLLAIRQDPQVRSLALKWASAPDLAEDILQAAYYGLATLKHPERIDNLHAYFLKALRNEANRIYSARRTMPVEDPEDALASGQHGTPVCGAPPARPFDETVSFFLQAQSWLKCLADNRDCLVAAVPARSDNAAYYRTLIYALAEQVLRDAINAEPSEADTNDALQAAWPEYFNPPGAASNNCHQRFRRARTDMRSLLQVVVRKEELL
jgi:DNA-directed RNA polymerase specialized sigma24 family protein